MRYKYLCTITVPSYACEVPAANIEVTEIYKPMTKVCEISSKGSKIHFSQQQGLELKICRLYFVSLRLNNSIVQIRANYHSS